MGASLAIAEADARKDWLGAPPPRPHVPARGLIFTNPWAWTSPRPPGPSTSPGQHGGPGPKSPLVQPGLSSRLTSLCPQRAAAAGVRPAQVRREAGGGASGGQVNAQVTAGDGRRPPGPPRPPEHPDKATTAPRCLVFPPSGGCRCCQDGETCAGQLGVSSTAAARARIRRPALPPPELPLTGPLQSRLFKLK